MGSILEMIIVLAAAAVLTMQGIKEDVANKRTALLQAEGQNQAAINAGLADYLTHRIFETFARAVAPQKMSMVG